MAQPIRPRAGSLLAFCVMMAAAWGVPLGCLATPMPVQEGLPSALVLEVKANDDGSLAKEDLRDQITRLEALAAWTKERQPKASWFQRFFGSSGAAKPVALDDLVSHTSSLRGERVVVEGVYEASSAASAEFRTDGGICLISVAGGTKPEGFGEKKINGLPAQVEGTVETRGTTPVIRATSIRPAVGLSRLRIARARELLEEPEEAVEAYLDAERAMGQRGDLSAFAHVRAARLSFDELRDKKAAGKHFGVAWTTYITNIPAGAGQVHVWTAATDSGEWKRVPIRDAIAETLDGLNGESFWYRFVAFFVAVCGGSAALGVLLIAVVVRVVIWPLTKKQLQSAEAMKKLQPQIKELQAKLSDDKQKFQQEFWKLCQANGVNPLGGCLPLLVQMPVLIMVYKGIRLYIVEFDKASFLWVENLASPDMILLVAYTISMILFQKMTQKTNPQAVMDPQQEQQQKMMMYMMPLFFFFVFKTFPASFILYWLGTNVIYFLQQWNYTRGMHTEDAGEAAGKTGSGGFVASMTRLLSGEPAPAGNADDSDSRQRPDPDRRSLEEIRKEEKGSGKRKKRRK